MARVGAGESVDNAEEVTWIPLRVIAPDEADHGGRQVVSKPFEVDEAESSNAGKGFPELVINEFSPAHVGVGLPGLKTGSF